MCQWLRIILFGLPREIGSARDKQKGSMASLTFPFSRSQLAMGFPFVSVDSCSFRRLLGRGREAPRGSARHFEGMSRHRVHLSGSGDGQVGEMHTHKHAEQRFACTGKWRHIETRGRAYKAYIRGCSDGDTFRHAKFSVGWIMMRVCLAV